MAAQLAIKWTLDASKRQAKSAFKKGPALIMQRDIEDIIRAIKTNIASAPPGSRCWPAKKDDAKVGLRIDWGAFSSDGKLRVLDVQLNTNSDDNTFKALAAGKGSHKKRATIWIPINEDKTMTDSAGEELKGFVGGMIEEGKENGL